MYFYKWLRQYAAQNALGISLLSFISIGVVSLELLEPWPVKLLVDSVFGKIPAPMLLGHLSKPHLLLIVSLSFIVIYGLESVMSLLQNVYLHRRMFRFDFAFMSSLFDKIQNLPLRYLEDKQTGDYSYRLNSEADNVSKLIFDVTNKLLTSFC